MKRSSESIVMITIATVIILFFVNLIYTMNVVTKRNHELKMKCADFETANTPICLKATYKN